MTGTFGDHGKDQQAQVAIIENPLTTVTASATTSFAPMVVMFAIGMFPAMTAMPTEGTTPVTAAMIAMATVTMAGFFLFRMIWAIRIAIACVCHDHKINPDISKNKIYRD